MGKYFNVTVRPDFTVATAMGTAYSDNDVTYNGEVFPRETINGKDMIKVDGKWKEAGDTGFPWEKEANNGNI